MKTQVVRVAVGDSDHERKGIFDASLMEGRAPDELRYHKLHGSEWCPFGY